MSFYKLIGGIVLILLSIFSFIYLIKNPIPKDEDTNLHMYQGYVGAFGLLLTGIILLLNELKTLFN